MVLSPSKMVDTFYKLDRIMPYTRKRKVVSHEPAEVAMASTTNLYYLVNV